MEQVKKQKLEKEFINDIELQSRISKSRTSLWRMRKGDNPLPHFKVKGLLFYEWNAVLEWIENGGANR